MSTSPTGERVVRQELRSAPAPLSQVDVTWFDRDGEHLIEVYGRVLSKGRTVGGSRLLKVVDVEAALPGKDLVGEATEQLALELSNVVYADRMVEMMGR